MHVATHPTIDTSPPLAEIALNAAIELDRNQKGTTNSEWLTKLSNALNEDVALFPVYDQALMSSERVKFASKADLYAKLKEISEKLVSKDRSSKDDRIILRDFCVALHDALLNQGYLSHYNAVSNALNA
jgi:hypothetical protein